MKIFKTPWGLVCGNIVHDHPSTDDVSIIELGMDQPLYNEWFMELLDYAKGGRIYVDNRDLEELGDLK